MNEKHVSCNLYEANEIHFFMRLWFLIFSYMTCHLEVAQGYVTRVKNARTGRIKVVTEMYFTGLSSFILLLTLNLLINLLNVTGSF